MGAGVVTGVVTGVVSERVSEEWERWRNRADHSVIYSARVTRDGQTVYLRRGERHLRVNRRFFEEVYERDE